MKEVFVLYFIGGMALEHNDGIHVEQFIKRKYEIEESKIQTCRPDMS